MSDRHCKDFDRSLIFQRANVDTYAPIERQHLLVFYYFTPAILCDYTPLFAYVTLYNAAVCDTLTSVDIHSQLSQYQHQKQASALERRHPCLQQLNYRAHCEHLDNKFISARIFVIQQDLYSLASQSKGMASQVQVTRTVEAETLELDEHPPQRSRAAKNVTRVVELDNVSSERGMDRKVDIDFIRDDDSPVRGANEFDDTHDVKIPNV